MEATLAVWKARNSVLQMFADEGAAAVKLDEVQFNAEPGTWDVLVNFTTPSLNGEMPVKVTKLVVISDASEQIITVKSI
jgi:hypothetical protein